jgi:triphosphatase
MNPRSTPDAIELELKFGLRDVTVAEISAALMSGKTPLHTRWLQNTYYDTADGVLHQMGVAIRTRSIDQQHEMTVKIREPDEGGLSRRQEWNLPIDTVALDRQQLLALPLPEAAHTLIQSDALQPVFLNQFHRTDWHVVRGLTEIMVSLDCGEVEGNGNRSSVSELELELITGTVDELIAVGCHLTDQLPAFMAVISKAERGEWLLRGGSPVMVPDPITVRGWLYRLSRMLDPLAGPNSTEAVRALAQCQDPVAIERFTGALMAGDLPPGLARWMVDLSLKDV